MLIIASSEHQKVKPESDYKKMLSKHGLVDPTLIKQQQKKQNKKKKNWYN